METFPQSWCAGGTVSADGRALSFRSYVGRRSHNAGKFEVNQIFLLKSELGACLCSFLWRAPFVETANFPASPTFNGAERVFDANVVFG